jgi:hypothetical protein
MLTFTFSNQPNWFAICALDDSTDANSGRSRLACDLLKPCGVALVDGDQQSSSGLWIEEECHQIRVYCGLRIDHALGEVAIGNQSRGHSFRLHALDGTTEKRDAIDLKLESDSVRQRHLTRVSSQTESGHIGHGVNMQPCFGDREGSILV